MIIGTAGHIDHGKTTLVRALTGVDTDRLAEEKKRGISIELGYAYLSAADGATLGFIDVPGHERLVHTMAAGASGIDFGLLVVAADDGVMPQTREHLAILTLLGIRHGAVVLTKCDRADDARQATALQQIQALTADTFLADAARFTVDATQADSPALRALLAHLYTQSRQFTRHDSQGLFRLAIDRAFSLPGHGTIVTGTVEAGTVRLDDPASVLHLMPQGKPVRVRSIHAQNQAATHADAGQRCALNITGVELGSIERGNWIADQRCFVPATHIDTQLRLLASAEHPIRAWTPVHVHLGASHQLAHAVPLSADVLAPGQTGWVQLVFDTPVCAMAADRFIIRNAQASQTIGGGTVLDANAPERKRKSAQRLAWLQSLSRFQQDAQLAALVRQAPMGLAEPVLLRLLGRPAQADDLAPDILWVQARATHASRILIARAHWDALGQSVLDVLGHYHERWPEEPGIDAARLRRMALPTASESLWAALCDALVSDGRLARNGPWLHLPSHTITLAPEEARLAQDLGQAIHSGAYDPPWVRDLAKQHQQAEDQVRGLLRKMARTGHLHQVVPDLFYDRQQIARLAALLDTLGGAQGVTAAQFRDASGLGRKRAIQVLEFFDRAGYTRRLRDRHVPRGDSAAFWKKLS
ncbi:selenocysteine-specific translation elongation factor [Castellaniella caeni]|uniref:selenocysteine-specific translation elongation factor n=1 Tax=Castellaniella caeni TaxID=266123 RepID=UPI000829E071|nr:selenocysteine-specific translation elongation factor [Castellaniella caeni]